MTPPVLTQWMVWKPQARAASSAAVQVDWGRPGAQMSHSSLRSAGAVQCGFCIPGMVLCAKALLSRNPDPSGPEIRYALRNNYCRCTGYVKIVRAVALAGEIFRSGVLPEGEDLVLHPDEGLGLLQGLPILRGD